MTCRPCCGRRSFVESASPRCTVKCEYCDVENHRAGYAYAGMQARDNSCKKRTPKALIARFKRHKLRFSMRFLHTKMPAWGEKVLAVLSNSCQFTVHSSQFSVRSSQLKYGPRSCRSAAEADLMIISWKSASETDSMERSRISRANCIK